MRVGVVGLGFGAAVHVPALRRIEGVEVVAIAGTAQGSADTVAQRLGIPHGCASVTALLEHGLDAVTVAVPPDRQKDVVAAVLRAGLPVLAEKPLCATVADAQELVELAGSRSTAVNLEFAELSTFGKLRDAIAGGAFGDVREVHARWLTRSRAHERGDWTWKRESARGGGVLTLLGSHMLYLLEWLVGPVTAISADAPAPLVCPPGVDPERVAISGLALHCRAGDGIRVSLTMDNASDQQVHDWRVVFDRATLVAVNTARDTVRGFRLVKELPGGELQPISDEPADAAPDDRIAPVASIAARFAGSVVGGTHCCPDFAAGLRVQELMSATEEAVRSATVVEVAQR